MSEGGRWTLEGERRLLKMDPYVTAAETHTGGVVFVGDLAYKVKKPVALGFVDWREREARREALERELELNRRLAPDVYLGTGELPHPGGTPEPALVMRRLPAERRLSMLVARGCDVEPALRDLAHQLAAFHLAAPATATAAVAAGVEATRERWEVNHERMAPSFGTWVDGDLAEDVVALALQYLAGRRRLLDVRIAAGRARDGHGDLLADDVFCLDDGPRALDCLDFDERLRAGDVLADVAFLAMDLERLGRPDLGRLLLDLHRQLIGDTWPASLAHHHVAYRAQVRAMVACLRADQGDPDAGPQARALLELSHRHLLVGRVRLVMVGGAPATGKTTVAAGIGDALGGVVLRSDEIRKELTGLPPGARYADPLGAEIYTSQHTARTYATLVDRAKELLVGGETVVLDATWLEPGLRQLATEAAAASAADVVQLRCVAPVAVAAARARARAAVGTDASDADAAVSVALAGAALPWPTAIEIDTLGTPDAAHAAALAALAIR